jgi:hypothetical protein
VRLGIPLIVGCLMIAAMVVVQAIAIGSVTRLLRRNAPPEHPVAHWLHNVSVAARALLCIVAAQLVQIAAWAALFVGCREFDDFPTAFYHSAVNFSTLGYGDIVMSPAWRLLGPLEAIAGMLMFGISTAVLFWVIESLIRGRVGVGSQPHR